jgi:hypothetical protein
MHCPVSLPAPFASHPWLVINSRGRLERWEVVFRRNLNQTSWGHLHRDLLPPFSGIEIIPYLPRPRWSGSVLEVYEGGECQRLIRTLRASPEMYPLRDRYAFTGPNSNTYVRWVLQRSEVAFRLPRGSIGQNYQVPV